MEHGQAFGDVLNDRRCGACDAAVAARVTQTVVANRIACSVSLRCHRCGDAEEQCGWDEMPRHWRNVLVAQNGLTRVCADRLSSQSAKVRLLSVFRQQGATIAEAIAAFESLTDIGIVGTPAEMTLLAGRLTSAGANVSLTPASSPGPGHARH